MRIVAALFKELCYRCISYFSYCWNQISDKTNFTEDDGFIFECQFLVEEGRRAFLAVMACLWQKEHKTSFLCQIYQETERLGQNGAVLESSVPYS